VRLHAASGFCLLGTIAASGCFAFDWGYQGTATGGGGGASSSGGGSTSTSNPTTGGGGGSGGGRVPVTTVFFGEGSRLEAHYYDYGGGVNDLIDWYDTKLKVNCTFTIFAGKEPEAACIPRTFNGSSYFSDSDCKNGLISLSASSLCPGPQNGLVTNAVPSCDFPTTSGLPSTGAAISVHESGGAYGGFPVYQYNATAKTCTQVNNPSGLFLKLGKVTDPKTFVTAKLVEKPRGHGLTEKIYQGSDGSWQLYRTFDSNGPCVLRLFGDTEVCLSVYTGYSDQSLFSDAACTAPTTGYFANTALCSDPVYLRVQTATQCVATTQFFTIGGQTATPFYYLNGATCTAFPTPNVHAVTPGAEVPLSDLPIVDLETIGSGRIQETFFGTSKTEALGTATSHLDVEADRVSCSIYRFDATSSFAASTMPQSRCPTSRIRRAPSRPA
jgi:hypothetical protein